MGIGHGLEGAFPTGPQECVKEVNMEGTITPSETKGKKKKREKKNVGLKKKHLPTPPY